MSVLLDKLQAMRAARRADARLVGPLFLLVMLSTLAYFTSIGALQPTLPLFVEGPLGHGNVAVGAVIGSFALAAVVLRPIAGRLGDTRGRKVLIVTGAGIWAVTIAGYIFVESLQVLLTLRVLSGIGEAFFYVGVASVINDIAPDERRGEALSYFSLALFGGLAIGPVVGESVLHAWNFDAVWGVAAGAAAIAAICGLWVPDTRPAGTGMDVGRRLVHRAAIQPGTVLAANIWGLATFTSFIPLYVLTIGLSGSRFVFAFHSAIVISFRLFGAKVPDRIGPARSARYALILVAAGLGLIGAWASPAGLFVGTFLYSIGHSLAFPALMTMAIKNAPASERGSVVGTFTAFFDLSFGIGAFSAGAIAAAVGYRGAFGVAALVAVGGLVMLFMRARRRAREREAAGADSAAA